MATAEAGRTGHAHRPELHNTSPEQSGSINDNYESPDGDRPNVLVGGFPTSGAGSTDMYEIYGNLFFHNPREALFQGSGRLPLHDNVFVDGNKAAAVLQSQDLPLSVAYIYNNTVYCTTVEFI